MPGTRRWEHCITHHNPDVISFINGYFREPERKILLIAAAGFDPRSAVVCRLLSQASPNIRGILVREERPDPAVELTIRAEKNLSKMKEFIPVHTVRPIEVFGEKNSVVGGRNIVQALSEENLDGVTDVVVDSSALSIGVSFPLITYLDSRVRQLSRTTNLHVFVDLDTDLDHSIKPIVSDTATPILGLRGRLGLDESVEAKKLWMPQLAHGRQATLGKIHQYLESQGVIHDVCPIVPFPAKNPRLGDDVVEGYLNELENSWNVDARNLVFAAENDPLDLYRTILRIDDLRTSIFRDLGGSKLVLSPVGSKVMALGALMAAIERNLPIIYLEAIGYECPSLPPAPLGDTDFDLIHVWLAGEIYP